MSSLEEMTAQLVEVQRRLADVESALAIQARKARYGALVDERFVKGAVIHADALARVADDIASLFTKDGVWDGGPGLGQVVGRAEIAARLRQPTLVFSRHFFLNPRIDVDADAARARWDLLSPCRRPDGTSYWMSGYEDDVYARVDGHWLHRSMTLTTVFMSQVGEGWDAILR